jgi:hypothetical protein
MAVDKVIDMLYCLAVLPCCTAWAQWCRVISDVESLWEHNLLHAAAALVDFNSRLGAVTAVANKAAEQGWTDVFTAKSSKKQLPSAVCKNDKIKKIIREAEAAARQTAAAKARASQKAAAANASTATADGTRDGKKQSSGAAQPGQGSAAAAKTTEDRLLAGDAGAAPDESVQKDQQQQKAAAVVQPAPGKLVETDKQRRMRLSKLLFQIPAVVQAAAAPSPSVVAAAAAAAGTAAADKPQLRVSQQAARDAAIVKGRIAVIAPEQLPDKDVAMGEGVLPGAAAAAAAASKQRTAQLDTQLELDGELECELECENDEDGQEEEVGQDTSGNEVGEHSLESLPWEFVITAEGLRDWMRLEE